MALAQMDHLSLLQELYHQIHIPWVVWDEVVIFGGGRPGAVEVCAADWIQVVEVHDTTGVRILRERLGAGESEAIVLAIELEADMLLMDEARGRRVAEGWGLNTTGTLGTLIMAKKQRLIPAVTPLLDRLRAGGFRMSEDLYWAARSLAGETD